MGDSKRIVKIVSAVRDYKLSKSAKSCYKSAKSSYESLSGFGGYIYLWTYNMS